ncbi:hypothetical protein GCM10010106_15950 [Thermopolyspora flexuosa]|jgi:hypothetical protein|uniref:Uncharacterized protein n=1 Tax=Thermopolyspora flexuosa TaxID=103836 RepID=A0A543IPF3_9ACTN|nr:hypothetical protein [Thermopolyspora flexuosa]TQM72450.1 hypothetical protein FHX40_4590 [Thermopolyspora flexuosa]GGM70571.1 hypothetical protein GCM10010106_15950 [Thermopolyspora flexuosa]
MTIEPPEDPHRILLRQRLSALLARAERASPWRGRLAPLRALVNRDGYVPVRARLTVEDLDFLASAREEVLSLSGLLLRLLDLHQPRDAGGITNNGPHPVLRCRSCMWRWPCPTFRALSDAILQPAAHAAGPGHAEPAGAAPGEPTGAPADAAPAGTLPAATPPRDEPVADRPVAARAESGPPAEPVPRPAPPTRRVRPGPSPASSPAPAADGPPAGRVARMPYLAPTGRGL